MSAPDDIGKALRALRDASGLTGDAVARRASMSPGKLSKIEHGKVLPSVLDVDLVLTALGVSRAAKEQFLAQARSAATEETAWRLIRRTGFWKHQQAIQAVEDRTRELKLFQGQLIPGLLQTPEYISAVFDLSPDLSEESRTRTTAARLARQQALHDPGRSFHLLICEHVLRWRICDSTVMAVQLDRLVSLSRLPNVVLGLLPQGARMPDFPMTCFSLHDDRLVIVETFHSEITTRNPKDLATYLDTFERFAAVAVYDARMRAAVEAVRDEYLHDHDHL
ncbi:Helix-turn-helix domain-containing protein [Streptomyces sp. TLI_053]|uniref:helix-turn-helix domain-containing protein n=1 Tax=Streptomyces sp. TLI_053 TaxID=1855352 RepID=UPI00087D2902|nr:helix-turn-helix transcriptional regulator [Streptomyces sp. TLI_053]SDT39439.1 Helix-turn-helix domain-containing protein [Streptomyces sp. TLI_053]